MERFSKIDGERGMIKPYLYPKPSSRTPRFDLNRPKSFTEDEGLTEWWHGKEATDIEERFGRSLDFHKKEHSFRIPIPVAGSRDFKELDFLVEEEWPIAIYGEIGHDSAAEQGFDIIREIQLNETFSRQGLQDLTKVWWWRLTSQDQANETVGDLFF